MTDLCSSIASTARLLVGKRTKFSAQGNQLFVRRGAGPWLSVAWVIGAELRLDLTPKQRGNSAYVFNTNHHSIPTLAGRCVFAAQTILSGR